MQKLRVFGRWEGYKSNGSKGNNQKPWFQVRKNCRILGGGSSCQVTVRPNEAQSYCYRIQGLTGKSAFKIVDSQGGLLAEVSLLALIQSSFFYHGNGICYERINTND